MKRMIMGAFIFAASIGFAASSMAADGAAVYKAKCMACHGPDGKGTPMAPAFAGNEFIASSSADDISTVILKGRGGAAKKYKKFAMGMPPQKLEKGEVDAIIEHLKSLAK